jgi:hypothetical protein
MNIFSFRVELTNPFDRWEFFKNLGCISGKLTKNKAWELEHSFMSTMLVDADITWSHNRDHAGLSVTIGLIGYGVHFHIYDTRHWDYNANAYA